MHKFYTNKLKLLALEYLEEPEPLLDSEIKENDITDIYEDEVYHQMLSNRECVNTCWLSRVRKGKSTANFAQGIKVQNGMIKLGFTNKQFSIQNIARTQYELSKKMRLHDLNNFFIACDEFDDLDNAQANSSIESALLKHFEKIQAGRYIHRGYCSPNPYPDNSSEIILNIDEINRKKRLTKSYVYYKVLRGSTVHEQLIGYIIDDVNPVIETWVDEDLEELFYSLGTNAMSEPQIIKWRKKDWYTDYMCRKFEKMNILNKHGIFQTRELDYADIYYKCVDNLRSMTKLKGFVNAKQVKNELKTLFRESIIPTTILGDAIATDIVDGVLDDWRNYYELQTKIKQIALKLKAGKIDIETYNSDKDTMEEMMHKSLDRAENQENKMMELMELKKRFYGEEIA